MLFLGILPTLYPTDNQVMLANLGCSFVLDLAAWIYLYSCHQSLRSPAFFFPPAFLKTGSVVQAYATSLANWQSPSVFASFKCVISFKGIWNSFAYVIMYVFISVFIIHLPCHRRACTGILVPFYVIQTCFCDIHMRPTL